MDSLEKIYCMDRGNSGLETAALLNGGMNNWMNNPFMYLIWLAYMGNGAFGFGNGNGNVAADASLSRQVAALQDTVNTNHNNDLAMQAISGNAAAISQLAQTMNCDYNSMLTAVNNVKGAIASVGAQVGYSSESVKNSILMGDQVIMNKLSECCCDNKISTITQGYEDRLAILNQTNSLQLGQTGINTNVTEARIALGNDIQSKHASTMYETQRQTCDILNNSNANTQRIIDTLNTHWTNNLSQELQDAKFEISQLKQNQYLINSLGGGCSCNA